jgi:hypothetical protein
MSVFLRGCALACLLAVAAAGSASAAPRGRTDKHGAIRLRMGVVALVVPAHGLPARHRVTIRRFRAPFASASPAYAFDTHGARLRRSASVTLPLPYRGRPGAETTVMYRSSDGRTWYAVGARVGRSGRVATARVRHLSTWAGLDLGGLFTAAVRASFARAAPARFRRASLNDCPGQTDRTVAVLGQDGPLGVCVSGRTEKGTEKVELVNHRNIAFSVRFSGGLDWPKPWEIALGNRLSSETGTISGGQGVVLDFSRAAGTSTIAYSSDVRTTIEDGVVPDFLGGLLGGDAGALITTEFATCANDPAHPTTTPDAARARIAECVLETVPGKLRAGRVKVESLPKTTILTSIKEAAKAIARHETDIRGTITILSGSLPDVGATATAPPQHAAVAPAPPATDDDTIAQAKPLPGGTAVAGAFATANDVNWYVLYTNPQTPLDISVNKAAGGCSGSIVTTLLDGDGHNGAIRTVGSGTTSHYNFTTPGAPARRYLKVTDGCPGDTYTIRADPAGALDGASPLAATSTTPATEPSEDITEAFGPLQPATAYQGTFESNTDVDWYAIDAQPQQPFDLAVTKVGPGCGGSIVATLLDGDGHNGAQRTVANDTIEHYNFTTPAQPTRYYLKVTDGCPGDVYQLRVDGPQAAVAASPVLDARAPGAPSVPVAEPQEDLAHAFGPLAGATAYRGAFESRTDQDWLVLNLVGGRPVDIAVTKIGAGCSGSIVAWLLDASGHNGARRTVASDTVARYDFTAPAGGVTRYLQLADGCPGDVYEVRADPADALSPSPPLPPAPAPIKPTGVALATSAPRDRKPPFRFPVTGRIALPQGADVAACTGAVVHVRALAGSTAVGGQWTRAAADCTFVATVALTNRSGFGSAKALDLTVDVSRSAGVDAASSPRIAVRVR